MKSSIKEIFIIGCTICAMFFGSGNIVLPLLIGQQYPLNWPLAYFGFLIGAVLLPLIGLISISLRDGSSNNFFKSTATYFSYLLPIDDTDKSRKFFQNLDNKISFILRFFILSIIGPLGIIPRCLTVAEGGFHTIYQIPNYIFHLFMICILWLVVCKKDQVMPAISKFLTPIKLTLLIGVVLICLLYAPENNVAPIIGLHPLKNGLVIGYQTLDLLGAIFLGTIIVDYIKTKENFNSKKAIFRFSLKSSCVGAIILSLLYLGFTVLAVKYSPDIINTYPEDIFPQIALIVLGKNAAMIVGITIVVSCLTTAVALTSVWTNFITECAQQWKLKINYQTILTLSLIVTYFISMLGLSRILAILAPILELCYPLIVLITIINLTVDIKNFEK